MCKKIKSVLLAFAVLLTGCSLGNQNEYYEKEDQEMPEINIPMTREDYDTYFSENSKFKNKITVADISKLTVSSGHISVLDGLYFWFLSEELPYYTENIPNGEYDVKASVVDYGNENFRVAAVLVEFTDEEPVDFKMALYEGQNADDLQEGYFYGFGVDSGIAAIADSDAMEDYLGYLNKYEEENPDKYFFTDILEPMLETGYEKYPDMKFDFIDYVIPETDHHIAIMSSGWGDGSYPTYFGYSKSGNLCCAVVQFIFTPEIEDGEENSI